MPPPTRANSAIDSAPREKPVNTSMAVLISLLSTETTLKTFKNMINKLPNPKIASPATPNPITVPPVKDTFKACFKLVLAA